jgi:large repetitive protein
VPQTLSVIVQNAPSGTPAFALKYGVDFSLGSASCTGSGTLSCSIPAAFAPKFPGLRQDAVVVKDSGGNVLTRYFIHGIGSGPVAAFYPGVISSVLSNAQQIPTGRAHLRPCKIPTRWQSIP